MERVLFVCTDNACRSPMAAAFFKHIAAQKGLSVQASSAGLDVQEQSPNAEAIDAANEHGIDISSHKAFRLNQFLVEEADHVFAMTEAQKRRIVKEFPDAKDKVKTLMEWVGVDGEIYDPSGKPFWQYQNCAEQVKSAVVRLMDNISRAAPVRSR